jgi:hypothetical protein
LIKMAERARIAFVDLQGFIVNDRFILKEICFSIANHDDDNNHHNNIFNPPLNHHFIFKPPFDYNQLSGKWLINAYWLTHCHHGLRWSQGDLAYNKISECVAPLLQKNLLIFVKGEQKIDWLRELCKPYYIDCRNIEEIGCNISLRGEIIDSDDDE